MRAFIYSLLLMLATTSRAQMAVDSFISFEAGTSGQIVTESLLNSCTHGDGAWHTEVSLSVSALTYGAITNIPSCPALPGPVSVGGTVYNGGGTRCLAMRHDEFEAAVFAPSSSHSKICVGYWWSPGFAGTFDFNWYDEVSIMGAGEFCVLSWEMDGNTVQILRAHTQAGTSTTAIDLTPVGTGNAKWFWVCQLYDAGSLARIRIYDRNLNQVGSDSTLGLNNVQADAIHFGEHHGAPTANGTVSLYKDVIVAYDANAAWPMLPTNSAPPTVSGTIQTLRATNARIMR